MSAATFVCATMASAQSPADRAVAADVDTFVQKIMSISGTPGLAIAVVRGDQPILVKGYGFADLGRRIPVTEHTAFYIASTTKAFTALTLALMADRKTVDLDAPITRYLADARVWSLSAAYKRLKLAARVELGNESFFSAPQLKRGPLDAFAALALDFRRALPVRMGR